MRSSLLFVGIAAVVVFTVSALVEAGPLTLRKLSCWTAVNYNGHEVRTDGAPRASGESTGTVIQSGYIPETGFSGAFFQVAVEPDGSAQATLSVGNGLKREAYAAVESVLTPSRPLKFTTKVKDLFVSVLCSISEPETL
jgi:hypothetical protein